MAHITVQGGPSAPAGPNWQQERDQAASAAEREAAAIRRVRALRQDYLRHRMGLGPEDIAAVLDSEAAELVPLGSNAAGQLTHRDLGLMSPATPAGGPAAADTPVTPEPDEAAEATSAAAPG